MNRKPLLVTLSVIAAVGLCAALNATFADTKGDGAAPLFTFGAIADCQYCDADSKNRRYRLSPEKLRKCIADFNTQDLTHIVHLGDFIDKDWKSYDVVLPIMDEAKAPVRFALGNHDFSVADEFKNQVPERLGLKSRYYDFAVDKWRFLILDSNDVSLYAYPKGSEKAIESRKIYDDLGGKLPRGKLPTYNGAVGAEQLAWIEEQLVKAAANGETVILHAHHPVFPFDRGHNLWNDKDVVALLEKHPCVAAYINGHNHNGAYEKKEGIHYLTLKGMVDTEETSYCVARVFHDRIEIRGTGRQEDMDLVINRKGENR
jgi:3',5'-cyclic AMP phosphodiesterase CpdA